MRQIIVLLKHYLNAPALVRIVESKTGFNFCQALVSGGPDERRQVCRYFLRALFCRFVFTGIAAFSAVANILQLRWVFHAARLKA